MTFLQLKNIWKSNVLPQKNKIRIFNANVKAVLYRAETWRATVTTSERIQTIVNSCLRRILGVWWSETISNECLWFVASYMSDVGQIGDPADVLESGLVTLSASQSTSLHDKP